MDQTGSVAAYLAGISPKYYTFLAPPLTVRSTIVSNFDGRVARTCFSVFLALRCSLSYESEKRLLATQRLSN